MRKLIEFRNIVKNFDGQVVLKGVNLNIYENEFVTLLGPSGCGKTTLLRILGGFLEQDEGTVIFDGQCIDNVPPYKREINTVFQRYALFPHLNVYGLIGRIQTGSYTKEDGTKTYTTDVIVESVEFVESKSSGQSTENGNKDDQDGFMNIPDSIDDELPFS